MRGKGEGQQTGVQLVITRDACLKRCPWVAATVLATVSSAAVRMGVSLSGQAQLSIPWGIYT